MISLGAANAMAAACATSDEEKAANVRQLQTELMVAALKCTHKPELSAQYNSFVRTFGKQLVDNARVLQAQFKRNYPKDHQTRFDRFITQLANDASVKSLNAPDFCEEAPHLFDAVMKLDGNQMVAFAAAETKARQRCN
jgi:hypothetical protein